MTVVSTEPVSFSDVERAIQDVEIAAFEIRKTLRVPSSDDAVREVVRAQYFAIGKANKLMSAIARSDFMSDEALRAAATLGSILDTKLEDLELIKEQLILIKAELKVAIHTPPKDNAPADSGANGEKDKPDSAEIPGEAAEDARREGVEKVAKSFIGHASQQVEETLEAVFESETWHLKEGELRDMFGPDAAEKDELSGRIRRVNAFLKDHNIDAKARQKKKGFLLAIHVR